MKPLKKVLKTKPDVLIEAIRAALDCPSHFYKPTIINNDPDFDISPGAIVICQQCVERLRDAIGLEGNEPVPTNFQYFFNRPKKKIAKGKKR
jgi:hypothetical protein